MPSFSVELTTVSFLPLKTLLSKYCSDQLDNLVEPSEYL